MAKFAIMQMFHLVAISATNASILKLKRQYPGSVVPLAMFIPRFDMNLSGEELFEGFIAVIILMVAIVMVAFIIMIMIIVLIIISQSET